MSFCGNHDINFTLSLKEILDVSVKSNFNQSRTIFFSSTDVIECVRSCDQKPYLHNKTKGGICIKREFNPQENISVLQHGRRFFVYSTKMAAVTSCEHTLFFSYETDREKKMLFPREEQRREFSKELLNLYERRSFTLKAKLTYVTNLTVTVTSAQRD